VPPSSAAAAEHCYYQQQQQLQVCQGSDLAANSEGGSAKKRLRVNEADGEQELQQQQSGLQKADSGPTLQIPVDPSSPVTGYAGTPLNQTSSAMEGLEREGAEDDCTGRTTSITTTATIKSSSIGLSGRLSVIVGPDAAPAATAAPAQCRSVALSKPLEGPLTPDAGFIPLACQRGHASSFQELEQQQQVGTSHATQPPATAAAAAAVAASAALLGDSLMGSGAVPELQGELEQLMELVKQLAVHEALGGIRAGARGEAEAPALLGSAMQLIMAKISSIKAMRQVNECLAQARLAHDKVVAAEMDLIMKLQGQPLQQQSSRVAAGQLLQSEGGLAAAAGVLADGQALSGSAAPGGRCAATSLAQHLAAGPGCMQEQPHMDVGLDMAAHFGSEHGSCGMTQQKQQGGFESMLLEPCEGMRHMGSPCAAAAGASPEASSASDGSKLAAAARAVDHTIPHLGTAAAAAAALSGATLQYPPEEVLTTSAAMGHTVKLLDGEIEAHGSAGEEWWLEQLNRLPSFGDQEAHHLLLGVEGSLL
jgi:hypothetical protein